MAYTASQPMEANPGSSSLQSSRAPAQCLRAALALSQPARWPTVWSNCLAGWWLGGGGNGERLPVLFAGATLLCIGNSWLNDAFDADSDRQHLPHRPIPGAITQRTVWRRGLACLVSGALLLFGLNELTGGLGLGLIFFAVVYNTVHRSLRFAPVLKALCRLFLYLLGASIAAHGVTGPALWCGFALASYMTGVGCLARWEENPSQARQWPALQLLTPVFFALIMNADRYREPALLLSTLLGLWLLRSWRQAYWAPERALHRALSDLVAGIVFVDWLAIGPVPAVHSESGHAPRELSFAFIGLFLASLFLQRLTWSRNRAL